jgi:3-oxoacyl-[acyl-carrier-protein] synthase II
VQKSLEALWDKLKDKVSHETAVISGATGAEPATAEERAFLAAHADLAVRATGSYLGHGLEPTFPMNVALATLALQQGALFAPCDHSGFEKPMHGRLQQVLVTGVGHWRGEGLALVERVD